MHPIFQFNVSCGEAVWNGKRTPRIKKISKKSSERKHPEVLWHATNKACQVCYEIFHTLLVFQSVKSHMSHGTAHCNGFNIPIYSNISCGLSKSLVSACLHCWTLILQCALFVKQFKAAVSSISFNASVLTSTSQPLIQTTCLLGYTGSCVLNGAVK